MTTPTLDRMPSELLPCPFCGGEPTIGERPDNIDGTEFVCFVSCHCGGYSARAHQFAKCKTPEAARCEAIAAWNRRTSRLAEQVTGDGPGSWNPAEATVADHGRSKKAFMELALRTTPPPAQQGAEDDSKGPPATLEGALARARAFVHWHMIRPEIQDPNSHAMAIDLQLILAAQSEAEEWKNCARGWMNSCEKAQAESRELRECLGIKYRDHPIE